MWLLAILIGVPLIEIGLFIQVGGAIGLWSTLAIVVLTAIVGTILMRAQGFAVLQRLRSSMEGQGNPADPLAHGALILVAGLLMLTPGFFTDSVGFLLLFPPFRAAVIRWGAARFLGSGVIITNSRQSRSGPIDADYTVVDEDASHPGDSGWTKPHQ